MSNSFIEAAMPSAIRPHSRSQHGCFSPATNNFHSLTFTTPSFLPLLESSLHLLLSHSCCIHVASRRPFICIVAMSTALAKASRLKPEIRLAQAVSQFEADLSSERKAAFQSYRSQVQNSPPNHSDVMRLAAEIDGRASVKIGGGGRCFGPRLINVLQAVQQFAALGDFIVGSSQNIIACGVWALVRTTLLVSASRT